MFSHFVKESIGSIQFNGKIINMISLTPRDFEILGWCPASRVLPHGEVLI